MTTHSTDGLAFSDNKSVLYRDNWINARCYSFERALITYLAYPLFTDFSFSNKIFSHVCDLVDGKRRSEKLFMENSPETLLFSPFQVRCFGISTRRCCVGWNNVMRNQNLLKHICLDCVFCSFIFRCCSSYLSTC
jgi:hypothetical protein